MIKFNMESNLNSVSNFIGNALHFSNYKLVQSFIVIFIFFVFYNFIKKISHQNIKKDKINVNIEKITYYGFLFITFLLLAKIWFKETKSIATILGLLSAGIAISLKDIISNIGGWVYILSKRLFESGDRVEIQGIIGDVIDIKLLSFSMLEINPKEKGEQSTGRIIAIPNSKVLTESLANYSKGFPFVWHEISVLVTFESNWKKAKTIMSTIMEIQYKDVKDTIDREMIKAKRTLLINYRKTSPTIYTSVVDSGVKLNIRYLCPIRQRRITEQEIWESILLAFKQEPNIEFAYPTTRFFQ